MRNPLILLLIFALSLTACSRINRHNNQNLTIGQRKTKMLHCEALKHKMTVKSAALQQPNAASKQAVYRRYNAQGC